MIGLQALAINSRARVKRGVGVGRAQTDGASRQSRSVGVATQGSHYEKGPLKDTVCGTHGTKPRAVTAGYDGSHRGVSAVLPTVGVTARRKGVGRGECHRSAESVVLLVRGTGSCQR